ncbi:hypothetical protein B0H19DRAFT_366553 [Mycena capillaripes]|nr:hypothetical protein B0H19DRAFT_366553 [Mycena capillaripes]
MALIDETLGALLLGGVFSTFLFGIISMQAYNYARDFPKDSFILKASVLAIWLFELAHTICAWHGIYKLAVTFVGPDQGEHLLQPPQTIYITLIFSPLITTTVQIFFANRIRLFSGKWLVPVLCWIMAVLVMVFSVAMVVILCIHDTVLVLSLQFRWLMALTLALTTAADALIAVSMCFWLWNVRRSGFEKTRTIADILITWSIESTMIKSIPNIMQLILFLTQDNLLWIIFYLIKASLFSNSMLASLNGRKRMAAAVDSTGPTFINLNSAVPTLGTQGGVRGRNVVIQMTRMTETHVDHSGREDSGSGLESKTEVGCN